MADSNSGNDKEILHGHLNTVFEIVLAFFIQQSSGPVQEFVNLKFVVV
jgi:hypothetical protein